MFESSDGYNPLMNDVSSDSKVDDDPNVERESTSWFSGDKSTHESLDFDEVESVMWRKVNICS